MITSQIQLIWPAKKTFKLRNHPEEVQKIEFPGSFDNLWRFFQILVFQCLKVSRDLTTFLFTSLLHFLFHYRLSTGSPKSQPIKPDAQL